MAELCRNYKLDYARRSGPQTDRRPTQQQQQQQRNERGGAGAREMRRRESEGDDGQPPLNRSPNVEPSRLETQGDARGQQPPGTLAALERPPPGAYLSLYPSLAHVYPISSLLRFQRMGPALLRFPLVDPLWHLQEVKTVAAEGKMPGLNVVTQLTCWCVLVRNVDGPKIGASKEERRLSGIEATNGGTASRCRLSLNCSTTSHTHLYASLLTASHTHVNASLLTASHTHVNAALLTASTSGMAIPLTTSGIMRKVRTVGGLGREAGLT